MPAWQISLLVCTTAVGFWLWLYLLYGREYREPDTPEYIREPPSGWRPNEVGYLLRWGQLDVQDMTAMLMDLVRRGALRLAVAADASSSSDGISGRSGEQRQQVELIPRFSGELSGSERYLIQEVLFGGRQSAGRVSMQQFMASAREDPGSAIARYNHWKELAEAEAAHIILMDQASANARAVGVVVGLMMLLPIPILLIARLHTPAGVLPAFVGSGILAVSGKLRRRAREAAIAYQRWQAFRRYLLDFSRLQDDPAPAVVVWESYLVFAVTLGVADRVLQQFRALAPSIVEGRGAWLELFPNWFAESGSWIDSLNLLGGAISVFYDHPSSKNGPGQSAARIVFTLGVLAFCSGLAATVPFSATLKPGNDALIELPVRPIACLYFRLYPRPHSPICEWNSMEWLQYLVWGAIGLLAGIVVLLTTYMRQRRAAPPQHSS